MSGFKYVEDPILGKGRAEFLGGGTGGESYVAGDGIAIKGNTISATGGGGSGTVTGIEASVDGGTATITATGSTTSVKLTGTGGVDVRGNTTTGAIALDASDLSDGTQSVSKDLLNARWIPSDAYETTPQNALTLLHFSDIHADTHALARIVAEATALAPNINGMICTGDMVEKYAGDGYRDNVQVPDYVGVGSIADWWNPNVMTVIGNHDCANSSFNYTALSMANRDAYYIAPFESNWGITHTTGTSYYYKDYTTQNIRLIVLDIMLYGDNTTNADAVAQTSWLEGLLASAITSGLHVLIACHAAHTGSTHRRCSFSNFKQADLYTFGKANTPDVVINAVASAITNGLHFCGYIVGHHHRDNVWDATGDGTQLIYCITTANVTEEHQYTLDVEQYRSSDYDAFNLLSIDTKHTTLKLLRAGGANIDCRMRPRQFISVNYSTGVITDYEIARGVTPEAAGFGMEVDIDRIARKRYDAVQIPNSSTVTLQAGYGYQFTASSEVTLETEVQPSDSVGLESLLDITLSGGTVAAGENVILADTLTTGKRNICSVRYIDGIAVVNVLTAIGGIPADAYAVSIATGTSDGSLYYGLATSDKSDIYVSSTLDGQTLDIGGAVTNGAKIVHGNGVAQTIVSGGISCTSTTEFQSLSMNEVVLNGGTMTLGGVNVPSGGTVTLMSGCIVPRNVAGNGVFNLTGTNAEHHLTQIISGSAVVTGATFCNATDGTAFFASDAVVSAVSATFCNNSHTISGIYGAGYEAIGGSSILVDCVFSGNYMGAGHVGANVHCYLTSNYVFLSNCVIASGFAAEGGGVNINRVGGSAYIKDCLFFANLATTYGGALYSLDGATTKGYTEITGCTFHANSTTSGYGGDIVNGNAGGSMFISGCIFSQGLAALNNTYFMPFTYNTVQDCVFVSNRVYAGSVLATSQGSTTINGCYFSGNVGGPASGPGTNGGCIGAYNNAVVNITGVTCTGNSILLPVFVESGGTAYVSDTLVTGNTIGVGADITAARDAKVYINGGCSFDVARVNHGGSMYIGGTNTIGKLDTYVNNGYVTISSGASINLASSIFLGATNRITVETGGCVVNGASIAAGTYTQIVSSGGSAVAS